MESKKQQVKIDLVSWSSFITVIFLILQVSGIINWSWWQLMMPIFIAAAVLAVIFVIVVFMYSKFKRDLKREFEDIDYEDL